MKPIARSIIKIARAKQVAALEKPRGPRLTSEDIAKQTEEFLAKGGSITVVPPEATAYEHRLAKELTTMTRPYNPAYARGKDFQRSPV